MFGGKKILLFSFPKTREVNKKQKTSRDQKACSIIKNVPVQDSDWVYLLGTAISSQLYRRKTNTLIIVYLCAPFFFNKL